MSLSGAPLLVSMVLAAAVLVVPQRDAGGALRTTAGSDEPPGAPHREAPDPDSVAAAMVLLALGYRSGLATWRVLEVVADAIDGSALNGRSAGAAGRAAGAAPAAADLRQVAAALRWGASESEAWGSVGDDWSGAAHAVVIAHAAGVAPGPVLLTAADDLQRASVERLELAAAKVGVRLVAPLGLVLLPAFCLTTVAPLVIALGRNMLSG